MASMGFDKKTLIDLMSLVDDHKDDMNEATYVKMCNVMRTLNQVQCAMDATHQRAAPPPTHPRAAPPPTPPIHPRAHFTVFTRFQVADRRVELLRREVALAQVHINNPRVLNCHRQAVIEELTQQSFKGPRGGLKFLTNSDIQQHVQDLITRGLIVDQHDFVLKCLEKSAEHAMSHLRRQKVLLNHAITSLDIIRRERNVLGTDSI